jgi:hypothetical protein
MELVHQSQYFEIFQCDLKRCFCFQTENKCVHLSFCQLLALRKKVNDINLETHFYQEENPSGIEILFFCNREHVLVLDTYQVIDLKRLIDTTFESLLQSSFIPIAA